MENFDRIIHLNRLTYIWDSHYWNGGIIPPPPWLHKSDKSTLNYLVQKHFMTTINCYLHAKKIIHLPTTTNCLSQVENNKKNQAIVRRTMPTTMKPVVATHSPGWSVVTQTSGWLRGCWHVIASPNLIEPADEQGVKPLLGMSYYININHVIYFKAVSQGPQTVYLLWKAAQRICSINTFQAHNRLTLQCLY